MMGVEVHVSHCVSSTVCWVAIIDNIELDSSWRYTVKTSWGTDISYIKKSSD